MQLGHDVVVVFVIGSVGIVWLVLCSWVEHCCPTSGLALSRGSDKEERRTAEVKAV